MKEGASLISRILVCWLWLAVFSLAAGPLPAPGDAPLTFFTNVATRLLQKQLNVRLDRIQIYPTNEYRPDVHRLLQVAANVYDCTTNRANVGRPYLPSVFRPLFTNDHGAIYICGYAEVTGVEVLYVPMRDPEAASDRQSLGPLDMR